MPATGFDSITTIWTWPTLPWWLIAGALFGLLMLIGAPIFLASRRKVTALVMLILAVVSVAVSFICYFAFPLGASTMESTRVVATGTVTESVPADDGARHLTVDTDPTWVLIVTGDDATALSEPGAPVNLQCEWGTAAMACTSELTGPQRPLLVPWWAEFTEMTAVLLPSEGLGS